MQKFFEKADPILLAITRVFAVFSFIAIIFMMVFISVQVAAREFFQVSIKGCYEIVEISMATCVFTSLAYTEAKHGHVHVTLLIRHLPPRLQMFVYALMNALATALVSVAVYAAFRQAMTSAAAGQVTAVLAVPYEYLYIMLSVSMLALAITLLYSTCKSAAAILDRDVREDVTSHWT